MPLFDNSFEKKKKIVYTNMYEVIQSICLGQSYENENKKYHIFFHFNITISFSTHKYYILHLYLYLLYEIQFKN